jgi:phosphoadenosine phosphosulfate reductase
VVDPEARPVEVNPLAHWSHDEIESFVRENQIPYNPLHDQGYPSIGCWPCTQPVEPGADLRSGRWSGTDKQECGIWVEEGQVKRANRPAPKR